MTTGDIDLGPEWAALELIAPARPAEQDDQRLVKLMRHEHFHWGELLEQALRHKLLPMLAHRLSAASFRTVVPWHIRSHLGSALLVNRQRIAVYRAAATEICTALDKATLTYVATKGITFESTLYQGNCSRYMNDLDFMVLPEDRGRVVGIMEGLGYQAGSQEPESAAITPHSRKELIVYRLNPDHIPIMTRLTGDPVTSSVRVDFANSLTWTRSPFDVPVKQALADRRRQPVPGHDVQIPVFHPWYQFIFTALHLFREAWIERWLNEGEDVNLVKFVDMCRLWATYEQTLATPEFRAVIARYELADPLAWVLEHLDRVMGTEVVAAAGLAGVVDPDRLNSAYRSGGGLVRWRGTMRERLWKKDRPALFESAQATTG